MILEKSNNIRKVAMQCLLLALPTILFAFLILHRLNEAYPILKNQWIYQGIYFALGVLLSIVFYGKRFRFVSTTILLCLLFYIGYKLLRKISVGEFDMFFFSVQYGVFVFIFIIGWLVGSGFSRRHIFTISWVLILFCIEIILISKVAVVSASVIVFSFAPVLLYGFYIIYTAELVRKLNERQTSFGWYIARRMFGFMAVVLVVIAIIFLLFRKELFTLERAWKNVQPDYSGKNNNSQSLTKTNRDGTLSNNGQMPLGGSLNKTKQLVFVAHLDNPLPESDIQNPLYFTANYYTKFDSATQAFETDSLMPYNDLFAPDPSEYPLFFTQTDSSVIKNSQAILSRKVVETQVYKVALSAKDFIAPNTAFAMQPIPVPNEYEGQYSSAYNAKMWVSDLNSAYFVYNPAGDSSLEKFQEQRFALLRPDTIYTGIDSSFIHYYTKIPQGSTYKKIEELAYDIVRKDSAQSTIDKIIAIRNYFLSKDEFGQPLFQYTDNPGEPGLPNANKLSYFLFENRKGYCAYFAGATLFMLRALHIPSRIATGFLTVDRSSKNPGWYWFYEDQAHAWVQAFFPGYGWIDFDTTIPDINTQQAPQPDGTPPLGTQKVYFVADGTIENIDTSKKLMQLSVNKILYKEKSFSAKETVSINTDIAFARCTSDTGLLKISDLTKDMHISAASYDASLDKAAFIKTADTAAYILNYLKKPISIDEIKVIEQAGNGKKSERRFLNIQALNWSKILWVILFALIIFMLLIIFAPFIIWQYFNIRAGRKIQTTNTAVLFYLNQLGYARRNLSPQAFAENIDKKFMTDFNRFNSIYQKDKYSKLPLSDDEQQFATNFYKTFIRQLKSKIYWKERWKQFFHLSNTLFFFMKH
ncbi:MAG: transglutaminase-like domain-containing protein [Arachidicoccus sp.]|nr:transglutaminase-like domain-containing protein [Arachidicoccus sp.]